MFVRERGSVYVCGREGETEREKERERVCVWERKRAKERERESRNDFLSQLIVMRSPLYHASE